jgi:hypothetical protein
VQYGTNQARGESQAAHNNDRDHVVNFRKPFKNPYAIEWAERQEIKKTSIKDAFDDCRARESGNGLRPTARDDRDQGQPKRANRSA